jgi:hypothetical protein
VGLAPRQTRTQDAFRWLDLRPCDRSGLARAPFNVRSRSPRTLSPTANWSSSFLADHRVRLTLGAALGKPRWHPTASASRDGRRLREPCGPLRHAWEDASTQRLQPTYYTSTPRIVRPSNHRLHRLSPLMTASTPFAR